MKFERCRSKNVFLWSWGYVKLSSQENEGGDWNENSMVSLVDTIDFKKLLNSCDSDLSLWMKKSLNFVGGFNMKVLWTFCSTSTAFIGCCSSQMAEAFPRGTSRRSWCQRYCWQGPDHMEDSRTDEVLCSRRRPCFRQRLVASPHHRPLLGGCSCPWWPCRWTWRRACPCCPRRPVHGAWSRWLGRPLAP